MPELQNITELQIETGIRQACDEATLGFFSPLAGEVAIARSREQKAGRKTEGLNNVVAVQFILTATLNTLNQPHVQESLPLEIAARGNIARSCAKHVIRQCIRDDRLRQLYRSEDGLRQIVRERSADYFADEDYFNRIARGAFEEIMFCAGGAYRRLQNEQAPSPLTTILSSDGLGRTVARIKENTKNIRAMYTQLGYPYVRSPFLEFAPGATKVSFTQVAEEILKRLETEQSGCPALKLGSDDLIAGDYDRLTPRTNVVTQSWRSIVPFLIPEGATAKAPNSRPRTMA